MRDLRSPLAIKIDAFQRLLMWHTLSGLLPLYLVTEYPRSGGTWVGQMLAAYFEVPFPRNQRPPLATCVMHGHHLYSPTFRNVFCVIRDGRDVMVSAYYHRLFHNDRNHPGAVDKVRRELPLADYYAIRENMPAFIEYMFTKSTRGIFHFSWRDFIYSWIDKDVPIIKYEDLLTNAAYTMGRAIQKVTGEQPDMEKLRRIEQDLSFQNLTKRKPGEEKITGFLRKGIAGDWKSIFTYEACEIFDRYAGDALILAGYEKDRGWITK